jgi:hypothetical protein
MSVAELEREVVKSFTASMALAALLHAGPERLLRQKGPRIVRMLVLVASATISACSPVASQPTASSPAPNHGNAREFQKPDSVMKRAAKAASEGQTDLALRLYLWVLDYGVEVDSAFVGVRSTYLIHAIIELGAVEPSAVAELEARAARLERLMLTSKATEARDVVPFEDILLYVALNEQRNQRERTQRLYHQLRQQGSPVADDLYDDVFDFLLEQRKYADILDREDWCKESLAFKEELITIQVAQFRRHAADVFEYLAGTNRSQDAMALLARVEARDPSTESFVMLVERALRASNKDLALLVLRRGRERAPPGEQEKLTQAAREFGLE